MARIKKIRDISGCWDCVTLHLSYTLHLSSQIFPKTWNRTFTPLYGQKMQEAYREEFEILYFENLSTFL